MRTTMLKNIKQQSTYGRLFKVENKRRTQKSVNKRNRIRVGMLSNILKFHVLNKNASERYYFVMNYGTA